MSNANSPFQSLTYTHNSPYTTISTPSSNPGTTQGSPEVFVSPGNRVSNPCSGGTLPLPLDNDCVTYPNLTTSIWSAGSMETIPLTPFTGLPTTTTPGDYNPSNAIPPPLNLGHGLPDLTGFITPLPSGITQMLPPAPPPNTASIPQPPTVQTQLTPAFSTLFQPNLFGSPTPNPFESHSANLFESPTPTPTSSVYNPIYPNSFQTTTTPHVPLRSNSYHTSTNGVGYSSNPTYPPNSFQPFSPNVNINDNDDINSNSNSNLDPNPNLSSNSNTSLISSPLNPPPPFHPHSISGPHRTPSHSHSFSHAHAYSHPPNIRRRSSTIMTASTIGSGCGSGIPTTGLGTPATPLTAFSPIGGYGNTGVGYPYPSPGRGWGRQGAGTSFGGNGVGGAGEGIGGGVGGGGVGVEGVGVGNGVSGAAGGGVGGMGKRVFQPGPSPAFGMGLDVFGEEDGESGGIRMAGISTAGILGDGAMSFGGGELGYGSMTGVTASGLGVGPGTVLSMGSDGKPPRFRPTKEQLEILVESYNKNPNPDAHERDVLLKRLGGDIKAKTLQIWFQNRRSKSRARERDAMLPSKLHLRGRLSLGGRGSLGGKVGVDLDAIRGLIRDDDPNLMIVPLNVLRISEWTRFLTPGLGYTTPDLACTLQIPSSTPSSTSSTYIVVSPPPTLSFYINHNNQTFRLIIPITPATISDLKTQSVGEAFALGFTLMGGGCVEFKSWGDEGWKDVGDFTGGVVGRGGECELTGEKESLLPVYERIIAILGSSPTYSTVYPSHIQQPGQIPGSLNLDNNNRHRSLSAPQPATPFPTMFAPYSGGYPHRKYSQRQWGCRVD